MQKKEQKRKTCDVMMVGSSLCHHALVAASEAVLQWVLSRLSCLSALQRRVKGRQNDGTVVISISEQLPGKGRCLAHAFK